MIKQVSLGQCKQENEFCYDAALIVSEDFFFMLHKKENSENEMKKNSVNKVEVVKGRKFRSVMMMKKK